MRWYGCVDQGQCMSGAAGGMFRTLAQSGGGSSHDDTFCEVSPSCINCGEAHNAYSKDFPRWKKEREIQRIKCLRNVSFPEARKIVEASNPAPPSGQSYAKVAAPIAVGKTTCSASTQTNLTWIADVQFCILLFYVELTIFPYQSKHILIYNL